MRVIELAYRLGPKTVHDLVSGSAGLVLSASAFILGCGFASTGTLVWYAFFGAFGVVSLHAAFPVFRIVRRQPEQSAQPECVPEPYRRAA